MRLNSISASQNPNSRLHRSPAWALLLFVIIFILYGSLFPFDFQSTPQPFENLYAELNLLNQRSDAIDNFLLFIPLGAVSYFCFNRFQERVAFALVSWLLLGVLLQIAQLYVPGRVASLVDSFWNAFGQITGMILAHQLMPWLSRHVGQMQHVRDRFALILVFSWLAYESFPFIPTLEIAELRNHVKAFVYAPPFEWIRLWQHLLAALLGTIALLRAQLLQRRMFAVGIAGIFLIMLEIFVVYGDLRRETMLGIIIGLFLGERLEHGLRTRVWYAVMIIAPTAYITTVLTPFRGQPVDGMYTLTPFSSLLWFGNTKIVSPAAYEILAIGSLLWAGMFGQRLFMEHRWVWPVLLAILLLMLESVRVLIVGLHGDTTPLIILGVLVPFAIVLGRQVNPSDPIHFEKMTAYEQKTSASRVPPAVSASGRQSVIWYKILALIVVIALSLWTLIQLPNVPYNLRELFGTHQLFGSVVFAIVLLWLGFAPGWIVQQAGKQTWAVLWLPFWLLLTACISLALLMLSVTAESLNDITGSTDLYRRIVQDNYWGNVWRDRMADWPAALVNLLERTVRFTALYWLLLVPLTICALIINPLWRFPAVASSFFILISLWWLAKWIVVDGAITDNLVELIAPNGEPYLGMLLFLLASHATLLSNLNYRNAIFMVIVSIFALMASWWLMNNGLEQVLFKYGSVFSAPQFLLGTNRTQWLPEEVLMFRWSIVYLGAVGVIAMGARYVRLLALIGR